MMNPNTPYKALPDCHKQMIRDICTDFGNDPGELIGVLHTVQGELGYLPEEVQREIALSLNIPVSKVYGVVTFYSFFTMAPKGRYPISVCRGTACYVTGAEKVIEALAGELGIDVGGVTPDGRFSLDCLRCVGACGLAPVMMIGEKVFAKVDPGNIRKILREFE